jgi:hypothetical protein
LPQAPATVIYKLDGRIVKLSDTIPIILDINADGVVDYTIFMELTANSEGDHLYAGINPIGANLIKAGPPNDDLFLNMGFLVNEIKNTVLDTSLNANQFWTADHSTLVIRHTRMDNSVWYEGGWKDGTEQIVAIQHHNNGNYYMGWLRIQFNKTNETITLVDYAYNSVKDEYLIAGYHQAS